MLSYKAFKNEDAITEQLKECIKKISDEYSTKQKSYEYFIKSYVYEITAILYRNNILRSRSEFVSDFSNLIPALEYIENHYKEHISLSQISNILHFNQSYFCQIFKKEFGITFVEYMNLVRISKAKELLKNPEKSITQVSFEVGFSSVAYFIKIFKKYNLYTPNKYKIFLNKTVN